MKDSNRLLPSKSNLRSYVRRGITCLVVGMSVAKIAGASPALAAATYTFSPWTIAPGNDYYLRAINDRGQVIGKYLPYGDAFFYDGSTTFGIVAPNGSDAELDGYSVNNSGQVIGEYYDEYEPTGEAAFLYSGGVSSQAIINIPVQGNKTVAGYPMVMNNLGDVAGSYNPVRGGYGPDIFLYHQGQVINLPTLTNSSGITGINDFDDMVGDFGLYSGGAITPISVPGAKATSAFGINNSGQVVGSYSDSSGIPHGFVYAHGTYTTLDMPGALGTYAYGINNLGQIVGMYYTASGGFADAFIANPSSFSALTAVSPFLLGRNGNGLGHLDLSTLLPKLPSIVAAAASGLAADGTSAAIVIFQTNVSENVTFTSNNGTTLLPYTDNFMETPPELGSATLTIPAKKLIAIGGVFYAAALLQAPPAGVTPAYTTPITITAEQKGSTTQTASLPLVPPPVFLVHGIWGTVHSLDFYQKTLSGEAPWSGNPDRFMPPIMTETATLLPRVPSAQ